MATRNYTKQGKKKAGTRKRKTRYTKKKTVTKSKTAFATSVVKTVRLPDFNLTTMPNTPTFAFYDFDPTDILEWSSYAGLYDEYRLRKVNITFESKFTMNAMSLSADPANNVLCYFNNRFYTHFDVNDKIVPTTIAYFLNRSGVRYTKLNRKHSRTISPRILEDTDDALFVNRIQSTNPWLSTVTPVGDYVGIKVGVEEYFNDTGPQLQPISYNVYVTYTIDFRRPQ